MNIGNKILLSAALIVVLTFAIFIIYFNGFEKETIDKNLKSDLVETSTLATTGIANWVSARQLLIENLGQNIAHNSEQSAIENYINRKSYADTFLFSYFGAADGTMTMFPNDALPDDYDPRKRPWYKDAERVGASALTEPYTDASTGQLIVTVTSPVIKENNLLGVVGGDLEIGILADLVRSVDMGGIGYAFLVNDKGIVLIHPDKKSTLKPMKEVFGDTAPTVNNGLSGFEDNTQKQFFNFTKVTGLPGVNWYLGLAIDRDKAYSSLSKFRTTAIITAIVAVFSIVIALGVLVRLWVSIPLLSMTNAMTRLAKGEQGIEVPCTNHKDEIGSMASAVLVFKNNAGEMVRLAQENEKNTQRLSEERKNARLHMADTFEQSVFSIVETVVLAAQNTKDVAEELSRNAEESNTRALAVSNAAEETTVSVQTVAASTEELSSAISEIAHQVSQSIEIANQAVEGVDRTSTTVRHLSDSANKIGEVVGLIQDIAGQTNLLALNATIEAARAGEAGKGFAVVASEVKTLANQTDKATGDIQEQVNGIQGSSTQSVREISEITGTIERVNEYANAIAAAVEQQGAATQEISESVQRAAAGTQEVSSNVTAVSEASHRVNQEADKLLGASNEMQGLAERLRGEVNNFLQGLRND